MLREEHITVSTIMITNNQSNVPIVQRYSPATVPWSVIHGIMSSASCSEPSAN